MTSTFKPEPLFKKTSTGKIQVWRIYTQLNEIVTTYGQAGGKQQTTTDVIESGKNAGRSNATTPEQQAYAEAKARYEKQLKKGYVQTPEAARAGTVDAVIEGGIVPMLAHRFDEHGHKIVYPAFAQPKFDGHRCVATVENGKARLWSRTRKQITGLPHIARDIEKWVRKNGYVEEGLVLDGELYNHDYRDNFEALTSFIRTPDAKPGSEVVQYHVYDAALQGQNQKFRLAVISDITGGSLVGVETALVENEDELMLTFERFLAEGYEGLVVRNADAIYENKRSYNLQKVKEFLDAEFKIVGVEVGRGKMADKAIFVCVTEDDVEFRVKMKGSLDSLKKYVDAPSLATGRFLTVQYQGITGASKVPRFPVGLRIRCDV